MATVIDLHADACRKVFTERVKTDRQGHRGDIVAREYDPAAMAADYPEVAQSSTPTVERK